jgi:hypothetical protein
LFGSEACEGEAVVDSIEGFGEACGEEADGNWPPTLNSFYIVSFVLVKHDFMLV